MTDFHEVFYRDLLATVLADPRVGGRHLDDRARNRILSCVKKDPNWPKLISMRRLMKRAIQNEQYALRIREIRIARQSA